MRNRSYIFLLIAAFGAFACTGCTKEVTADKDASQLEALIVQANELAASAVEGPDPGFYPVGSVNQLRYIMDSAQTMANNAVSQFGIDLAALLVDKAITQFKGSIQIAKQLYFDGTGYLDGGPATTYNTPNITIEAWVYPTEWKNAMYVISTEGTNTGYKLQVPNAKPTFQLGTGTGVATLAATASINLNEWTHIGASFDGNTMKLYVNGVLVGSKAQVSTIKDNVQNFKIGEGSQFTARTFKGRIRDVMIWDRILSDAEVTASMTGTFTGTETGLNAYWPFNLSAGTQMLDRTGRHTVTLVNMQYVDPI